MTKTKKEILLETRKYYQTHARGVKPEGGCYYFINDNMCAIGRCLKDAKDFEDNIATKCDDQDIETLSTDIEDFKIDDYLKNDYHGHEIEFWKELQHWHDYMPNWNNLKPGDLVNELNSTGHENFNKLMKKWN